MADQDSPSRALAGKLKVFISYSRKDGDFIGRFAEALAARGYAPDFDQASYDPDNVDTGISAEDEWWQRLQAMIAASDVMVFVVSPDSAASKVCDEEIAFARGLGKRIIPILRRPIDFAKAPPRLSALNVKINFVEDRDDAFAAALEQLFAALEVDVAWHRESRRLTELSLNWDVEGRPTDRLMRPAEMRAMERLFERRPRNADLPPQLLIDFLDASRARLEEEVRRARHTQAAIYSLMLGIIAALVGWINQSYLWDQANWYRTMRPYMIKYVRPHVLSEKVERALKPRDEFKECADDKACPKMVVVPPGTFTMGSPVASSDKSGNDRPQRKVAIERPFAVSKFAVTFADWDACVDVGGCRAMVSGLGWGRDKRPVINVSWSDAQQYIAWLIRMTGKPYRLLSEAEWEYAARANTETKYFWGEDIRPDGRVMANCSACGSEWDGRMTAEVGLFPANGFGLHDMHGNVFQWIEDCYYEDAYKDANPDSRAMVRKDCGRRVVRGGSWYSPPVNLRAAARDGRPPEFSNDGVGFRIARTLAH